MNIEPTNSSLPMNSTNKRNLEDSDSDSALIKKTRRSSKENLPAQSEPSHSSQKKVKWVWKKPLENISNTDTNVNEELPFDITEFSKSINEAVEKNHLIKIKTLLKTLFNHPENLQEFLKDKISDKVYFQLLKNAFDPEQPKVFRIIIENLCNTKPNLLFEEHFQGILKEVFNQEKWADCKIIANYFGEKSVSIFVYRAVLSFSSYFRGLFTGGFLEKNQNTIHIDLNGLETQDEGLILSIFRFLCTGHIIFKKESDAAICLKWAAFLGNERLKKECDERLSLYKNCDDTDIAEAYEFASTYQSSSLQKAALAHAFRFAPFCKKKRQVQSTSNNNAEEESLLDKQAKIVEELEVDVDYYSEYLSDELANQIFSDIPQTYPNLRRLTLLNIVISDETAKGLNKLSKLEKLEHLEIRVKEEIETSVSLLKFIEKLTTLRTFIFYHKSTLNRTDVLIECVAKLELLETLILKIPRISLFDFFKFFDLMHLTHLDISCSENMTKENRRYVVPSDLIHKLVHLSLPVRLCNAEFQALGPSLKELCLKNCNRETLQQLANTLYPQRQDMAQSSERPELESLRLNSCHLSSEALSHLNVFTHLKHLVISKLIITKNGNTTIQSAKHLAHIPLLEKLNVRLSGSGYSWLKAWIDELETEGKMGQIRELKYTFDQAEGIEKIFDLVCRLENLEILVLIYKGSTIATNMNLNTLNHLSKIIKIGIHGFTCAANSYVNLQDRFPKLRNLKYVDQELGSVVLQNWYWSVVMTEEKPFKLPVNTDVLTISSTGISSKEAHKKALENLAEQEEALENVECLSFQNYESEDVSYYDADDLIIILQKTHRLKKLEISDLEASQGKKLFQTISQLSLLEVLVFENCTFEDSREISCIENLKKLVLLHLSPSFDSRYLQFTKQMPSLQQILIDYTPIARENLLPVVT